jgi:hypothetical protein
MPLRLKAGKCRVCHGEAGVRGGAEPLASRGAGLTTDRFAFGGIVESSSEWDSASQVALLQSSA